MRRRVSGDDKAKDAARVSPRAVAKRFLIIFLPFIAALGGILTLLYYHEVKNEIAYVPAAVLKATTSAWLAIFLRIFAIAVVSGGSLIWILALTQIRRKLATKALRNAFAESRQREKEVSALLEASRAILKFQEFKDAARAIFDSCKNLVGATGGYVALLTQDGTENKLLFLDPGEYPCTADRTLPMPTRGLREIAYRTGKAVCDNDFPNSDWTKFIPQGHVRLDNVLFVPLLIGGKAVGLLGLANKPGGFTENDARIASAFGEIAAVGLLNSQMQEALRNSEERFRSVAQTASDAIITMDNHGNIVFWNRGAETIFGYSAEEAVGRPVTLIMPERFREAHKNGISRVVSEGKSEVVGKTVELAGLKKDNREFPLELSLARWETKGGVFFSGIIRDITERKQSLDVEKEKVRLETEIAERRKAMEVLAHSENALRDQTRILQSILNSMGEGVAVADEHGRLLFINPIAEQMLGLGLTDSTTDQWSGTYGLFLSDMVTPYPANELPLARAIRGEKADAVEIYVCNPNLPEGIYVNVTGRPIKDAEGILRGGVVVFHDITKRKQAEEEINKLYKEVTEFNLMLEDKVKQRTEELEAAVQVAEVANRAKSDFLASMSHELRTPLNAIIGFAQVLQERYFGELNEKQAEYINDMLESGKHLLSLINDILDLSKIEADKVKLELSATNIRDLLEHSLIMVRENALKHGISLDLKTAEALCGLQIIADERRLKQIIFNLLSNAAKFTPDGGAITVDARKEGKELIISVADTGIGIAPENQQKIFEEFYQVRGGTLDKTPGTGLGLSLTKRLVELHGGRIWVESEGLGKGSRFIVTLPIEGAT